MESGRRKSHWLLEPTRALDSRWRGSWVRPIAPFLLGARNSGLDLEAASKLQAEHLDARFIELDLGL